MQKAWWLIILLLSTCTVIATDVSTCQSLTAGNYSLTTSISNWAAGSCFSVGSNTNFDCQGFTIDGTDVSNSIGISVTGQNASVRNCFISDFSDGILLSSAQYAAIDNVTITSSLAGIRLTSSNSNNISHSRLVSNIRGFQVQTSSANNQIFKSNVTTNTNVDMYILSSGNIIFDNILTSQSRQIDSGYSTTWSVTPYNGTNVIGGNMIGGNYWTDFNAPDANNDGIADVGYVQKSGSDLYPLSDSANRGNITGCAIFHTPGEYYLGSSQIDWAFTCMSISSSNVTLDCLNYQIDGLTTNYFGIDINNVKNVTVRNCIVSNFDSPVRVLNSNDVVVKNSILRSGATGALLQYSANNSFVNNTYILNARGITLSTQATDNTFYDSVIENNTNAGVWINVATAARNHFFNNRIQAGQVIIDAANPYNVWNTNKSIRSSILGLSSYGGNYWHNSAGTGFSDTCIGREGMCMDAYAIATNNVDYFPLTFNVNAPSTSEATGSLTTVLPEGNDTALESVPGFTWHVNNTGYITWNGNLNFSLANTGGDNSISEDIHFGDSFVSVNSSGAPAFANHSANITFQNIDGSVCNPTAVLYQEGFFATKNDIVLEGRSCGLAGTCHSFIYDGQNCTFSATGFSGYAAGGNANLSIYDSVEGFYTHIGLPVDFTAIYLNVTSGTAIAGSCNITFDDGEGPAPMSFNVSGLAQYNYTKSAGFFTLETHSWNVTCGSQSFNTLYASDTVAVISLVPEFGTLGLFILLMIVTGGMLFLRKRDRLD